MLSARFGHSNTIREYGVDACSFSFVRKEKLLKNRNPEMDIYQTLASRASIARRRFRRLALGCKIPTELLMESYRDRLAVVS